MVCEGEREEELQSMGETESEPSQYSDVGRACLAARVLGSSLVLLLPHCDMLNQFHRLVMNGVS